MPSVQAVLDGYAEDAPYEDAAAAFLSLERWTGDDPVLLLAEAAASSTGQSYATGVKPTVERFREAVRDPGRATSFADLAALDLDDPDLVEAFGAQRKRRVLLEAARVLDDRPEADDLAALQGWAADADVYRYDADPIGSISGVGPGTFQYLRQLAGIDTATPDPEVVQLVDAVAEAIDDPALAGARGLRAVAACEWLSVRSSYRPLEIDRIAWWTFADDRERAAHRDAR